MWFNATVGLREKFRVHNIDQLATMMAHSFNIASGQHPKVVGRAYDLKSAYKQFPISEEARRLLRIAVHEPGKEEPHLMGLDVLPFGAVASVAAFLRISMAALCSRRWQGDSIRLEVQDAWVGCRSDQKSSWDHEHLPYC